MNLSKFRYTDCKQVSYDHQLLTFFQAADGKHANTIFLNMDKEKPSYLIEELLLQ